MKRWLAPVAASIILIAVLVAATGLEWERVLATLGALDPGLLALSFAAYTASFLIRGVRLGILLPEATTGWLHLTSVGARHILLAVVLPFRSGEATLPILLLREAGRPLTEGLAALGLMRVLDLASVAVFLLIGLAGTTAATPDDLRLRALAVGGLLIVGLIALRPAARLVARLSASTRKPLAFIGRLAAPAAALGTGRLLAAVATSLATWLATYATCFWLLTAMTGPEALGESARVDFATSLVGTTGLHLSAVIPISPVAGLGTWELGWTAGYRLTGMDEATAAESALVSHAAIFAFLVVLGGAGFLLRRTRWSG